MQDLPACHGWAIALLVIGIVHVASGNEDGGEGVSHASQAYEAPKVADLRWVETFEGDVWSRWTHSVQEKYNGRFAVAARAREALVGDVGLAVPNPAQHYGASVSFDPIEMAKDAAFIVQFEVRFQDGLSCGGSYIKLFDRAGAEGSEWNDSTPYVVMFGPDRCGATDKVHFILQHRSPVTGKLEEKHFSNPPSVPMDRLTHLYGLHIFPDNSVEIHIDGAVKAKGSLLTSMEPPVNPPKEIDDPADKKPEDWVDDPKMDDPEAFKPEDWDEEQPRTIPDPDATMPEGWEEGEQKRIPDPTASKPEDWDDEEDGEWEPPMIDNPKCKVGCGKWKPAEITNTKYKGKWHPPRIDNPAYKGVWKARQIANPDYFMDENPHILPRIDSVGIDIWTMQKDIIFDNLVISSNVAAAQAFADATFQKRHAIEVEQDPPRRSQDTWLEMLLDNIVPAGITALVVICTTVWCCCCMGDSKSVSKPTAAPKPTRTEEATEADKATADKATEEDEDESERAGAEPTEATPSSDEKAAANASGADGKPEGGLGDLTDTQDEE